MAEGDWSFGGTMLFKFISKFNGSIESAPGVKFVNFSYSTEDAGVAESLRGKKGIYEVNDPNLSDKINDEAPEKTGTMASDKTLSRIEDDADRAEIERRIPKPQIKGRRTSLTIEGK